MEYSRMGLFLPSEIDKIFFGSEIIGTIDVRAALKYENADDRSLPLVLRIANALDNGEPLREAYMRSMEILKKLKEIRRAECLTDIAFKTVGALFWFVVIVLASSDDKNSKYKPSKYEPSKTNDEAPVKSDSEAVRKLKEELRKL